MSPSRKRISWPVVLFMILAVENAAAAPNFSHLITQVSRRSRTTLAQSIPALSTFRVREGSEAERNRHQVVETAVKKPPTKKRQLSLPKVPTNALESGGFYYGISPDTYTKATKPVPKKLTLSDSMFEALEELRIMRQEMETMRKEMQGLKRKIVNGDYEPDSEEDRAQAQLMRKRRARESEKLASDIEKWALRMLEEDEEDGWQEVTCSRMMRGSLDPTGRTTAYLKVRGFDT